MYAAKHRQNSFDFKKWVCKVLQKHTPVLRIKTNPMTEVEHKLKKYILGKSLTHSNTASIMKILQLMENGLSWIILWLLHVFKDHYIIKVSPQTILAEKVPQWTGHPMLFPLWSRNGEAPRPPNTRRPADQSWRQPGAPPMAAGPDVSPCAGKRPE